VIYALDSVGNASILLHRVSDLEWTCMDVVICMMILNGDNKSYIGSNPLIARDRRGVGPFAKTSIA